MRKRRYLTFIKKSNQMKILHINNIASVSEILAKAQRVYFNHDVHIINIIPQQKKTGWWSKLATLTERIYLVSKARHLIKALKPDIVHIHYTTSAIWLLGLGVKIIAHGHGSDLRLKKHDLIRLFLNRIGLHSAYRIICSTPDLLPYARIYGPKTHYIPNPIDTDLFTGAGCSKNPTTPFEVLLFSAPTKIKGFEIAEEAIRVILEKYKNIRITVFKNEHTTRLQKSLNTRQLKIINPVPSNAIPSLLSGYDFILGQFILGAFGMSELEAFAASKTVICNAIYNIEYDNNTPHLQATRANEIVSHVDRIVSNPHVFLKTKGESAWDWVYKNHNMKIIAEKVETIYA